MTKKQFEKKFRSFCKNKYVDLLDTHVYSQQEWRERGEDYGNNADFTITSEGDFLHAIEYSDNWQFQTEFHEFLESMGYFYEQGYHWTFHLYRL